MVDVEACLTFWDQFSPQDDETDHPLKSLTKKYRNKQVKKIYFNINSTLTLNTHQLNTLNTHRLNHQILSLIVNNTYLTLCESCSNNLRNKSIRKVQTEGSRQELIFRYLTTTTSLSYWNNPRSKNPTGVTLAIIWQYLKTKNFPTLDKRLGLLRKSKLTKIGVPHQWQ